MPADRLLSRREAFLGGAALLATAGCVRKKPLTIAGYIPPPLDVFADHTLRAQAANHGLLAGFALGAASLRDSEPYRCVAAAQCSIAVSENSMKWRAIRPTADRFDFTDADAFVHFCESHSIKMRGHNLCWHQYLPLWLTATATADNARTLLVDHIRTVAGRYRGRMHSWDVVNEAIHVEDGRPDGLRDSLWLRLIGEDYLELAFRTARAADPSALLTYNEYGIEAETDVDQQKRNNTLLLLRRLRRRNVPLDAVGIQSHIKARPPQAYGPALRRFIQSCRDMDLEVFLTEMDVDDSALPSDHLSRDTGIAETYSAYLQAFLAEPNVHVVLTWGVDDAQTWLNHHSPRPDGAPQRPLLFDRDLRPKPAFAAVISSFATHPATTG